MKTAFIIHGTGGSPQGNWFQWLKSELEEIGYQVFVPKFPTPKGQSLDAWLNVFEKYAKDINEDTIFVAHSLGPAFVLNILEKINVKVNVSFLVSGFLGLIGAEPYDTLNKTFTTHNFDWNKIKQNCKTFVIINTKDDPYVPISKGEELAKNLNVKLIRLEKGGHLNADFGYTKFEYLLDLIKSKVN